MHPEGVPAILDADVIDDEALLLILKLPDHPGDRLVKGLDEGFLIELTNPAPANSSISPLPVVHGVDRLSISGSLGGDGRIPFAI